MIEILKEKTRIYYTGDMANDEGFGCIKAVLWSKWGTEYDIKLDDGRDFTVSHTAFGPEYFGHCNPRFVTEKSYREYREKQFQILQNSIAVKS